MDIDDLKDSLVNLLSLIKNTKDIVNDDDIKYNENDSLKDIIEKIRSLLWMNSKTFSDKVSNELEESFSNLIQHYPQELSEKESFMMRCTSLLTSILNTQQTNSTEEETKINEKENESNELFSKIFINKFSNGFGKELNDIQQEEQLSIERMNFLVQNLQDVKELYKDEKKYWLLNNK
ncbi:hypothetical protein BCR36DRAFT_585317 [Piromyces finnis]|uniref:Uncharacterized protein n=1 Tax=Piromyces finnis TaxID=1754191 RepID=A0A1Y1V406_9FUNG|nr:hypothetical protein BCR36DRAFT_585317 [Piromyces finnis]|eukprot:ORX46175.1 hypothetical protein BCR36DRAFT_585317 [Piromyces finnis]